MRARLRHFCCVLLFSVLSLPALAAKIPVGVMIYEGQTLDGSGVFHILLNPPAGLTFDKLTPSFFVDRIGHSFVLPPPQPSPPPLYDFLFLTVSGSGFGTCPCRSASFLFAAPPGTKVIFDGKKFVLRYRPAILIPLATDFWSRKSRLRFIWLPLRRAIELSRAEKLWPVCSDMPGYQRRKYMRVSVGRMMRTYNKAHPHAGG